MFGSVLFFLLRLRNKRLSIPLLWQVHCFFNTIIIIDMWCFFFAWMICRCIVPIWSCRWFYCQAGSNMWNTADQSVNLIKHLFCIWDLDEIRIILFYRLSPIKRCSFRIVFIFTALFSYSLCEYKVNSLISNKCLMLFCSRNIKKNITDTRK